jgi:hypothetical protein
VYLDDGRGDSPQFGESDGMRLLPHTALGAVDLDGFLIFFFLHFFFDTCTVRGAFSEHRQQHLDGRTRPERA